jgi:hypothetical protein
MPQANIPPIPIRDWVDPRAGSKRKFSTLPELEFRLIGPSAYSQSLYRLRYPDTHLRSIIILSTHLPFGLPSDIFPSGFPTNILHAFLFAPIRVTCPAHLIFLELIVIILFGKVSPNHFFPITQFDVNSDNQNSAPISEAAVCDHSKVFTFRPPSWQERAEAASK